MMKFGSEELKQLWRPNENSSGDDNGQITIIGGSELFQGAPLMSLLAASRLVDNVFLATPAGDKNIIHKEKLFEVLRGVIWVPRDDIDAYVKKSDSVLIGPGMMRYHRENTKLENLKSKLDNTGEYTKEITEKLLERFSSKKWVIDGGSLQTMDASYIPARAVVTPNMHEFKLLFGEDFSAENVQKYAKKYNCIVVGKNHLTYVSDGKITYELDGGNAGLTKGGTGDVLAGVIAGLLAKNEPFLAACAGVYLVKKTAERLFEEVGYGYNADDLAKEVFATKKQLIGY